MGDYLGGHNDVITVVLIRKIQEESEGNVTMGAETGVMWPHAQECHQPLKVGKDKKQIDFPLETSEGSSLSDTWY